MEMEGGISKAQEALMSLEDWSTSRRESLLIAATINLKDSIWNFLI